MSSRALAPPQFISLYAARDILDVDSDILVNFRLSMHVLHNCSSCKYCPTSSMSRLRMGIRNMKEIEICWVGNAFFFITTCDDASCLSINTDNAKIVKDLVEKKEKT
jgi:hypothetical protein